MRPKAPRERRIQRLAGKLAKRFRRQVEKGSRKRKKKLRPMMRTEFSQDPKPTGRIIAYDFETTSIKVGTPKPLYLTAYGADFWFSGAIKSNEELLKILETRFLTVEQNNCRYIAWNGNKFDCYFIAAALLHEPNFIIHPYLTRSKSLRGIRVTIKNNEELSWEFLDGIAMLGMQGVKLSDFLKSFAPDHQKLESPDFEQEEFNASLEKHRRYAEQDSIGLFHGLMKAQEIVAQHFGCGLKPTIGNMGIRIFKSQMPFGVSAHAPTQKVVGIIRDYVLRGGFCFCLKKYSGPIWKYDLNQAYAAAMRETWLPAGKCTRTKGEPRYGQCFIARVRLENPRNRVPLYIRNCDLARGKKESIYALGSEPEETWITSTELRQLHAEKWKIHVYESYVWDQEFTMSDYVNKLENLRVNAPGGPKSAQGQMMKYIGNNSYGKTCEELDGIEYLMSNEQPEGYYEYFDETENLQHVWFRFGEPQDRDYHQPHIGAFITAHVRMVVRRAILRNPLHWLYSDTDCVIFSRPVDLDLDTSRYGAWKPEVLGDEYHLIAKKVYAAVKMEEQRKTGAKGDAYAKGLNVQRLNHDDFLRWFEGVPPKQTQVQRQNFIRVMTGSEMFIERVKVGQRVKGVN